MEEAGISKRIWIAAAVAVGLALLAGFWFGRPAYRNYKEARSLRQARAFLEQGDYRSAVLSVRTALAINATNAEAARLMADLADQAQSPVALVWRRRVAELSPTLDNKILAAACALRFEKPPFPITAQTLEEVGPLAQSNTAYHLVASEMALKLNRLQDAETHLQAAAALQPTNLLHQLNLATLRLRSRDADTVVAARRELASLASDTMLGEHALRALVTDALVRKQFGDAEEFSRRLLALPRAGFDDRLQHLTVLSEAKSAELGPTLARAESEAVTNTIKITRLVAWLNAHDSAREALHWLESLPAAAREVPPVPLVEADAYLLLRDWAGLETRLNGQRWKDQEFMRLALLARALREQRRNEMADVVWRRATDEASGKNDIILAQMAGGWGWQREAENLLWTIAKRSPAEEWALRSLLQRYTATTNTDGLYRVYQVLHQRHPESLELKNNVAGLGLLLNRDVPRARELAQQVYHAAATNAVLASTYAFALHTQGRTAEGLKLMQSLPESELLRPNVAIYYACLLAAQGEREKARPFIAAAEKSPMLPEEQRLLLQARGGN